MIRLLMLAPLFTAAAAAAQVEIAPTPDAPVVTLTVQEVTQAAPDLATVSAGVETEAPTAGAALAANSAKMTQVLAAIRAAGIADRDVRTSAVSIGSRYDFAGGTRVFRGYTATNRATVLLRDVRAIGAFLDRVTAAGATDLNGPTFTVEHPDAYRAAARDRAVARAAAEAQAYARRAGFASARLLSITEQSGFVQPYDIVVTASRRSFAAAPPPVNVPVAPGEQGVGVTIVASYRLER